MNFSETIQPIFCGQYVVKAAENEQEVIKAQRLRFKSLRLEYNRNASAIDDIDCDEYDEYCTHLIVVNTQNGEIVATYRMINESHLTHLKTFLSEREFNIDALKQNAQGKICELGRAVVDKSHRNGIVLRLLWKGIAAYVKQFDIRYLIGTASFHEIDPTAYLDAYSYVAENYLLEKDLRCYAHVNRAEIQAHSDYDEKKAKEQLPSLIKGYIKIGARFGDGFYIDRWFNCLDMFILLDVSTITTKLFS